LISHIDKDFVFKDGGDLVLPHVGDCWLWEFEVGDVPGKIVKEDVLACAWQRIRETRLSLGILDFAQSDQTER